MAQQEINRVASKIYNILVFFSFLEKYPWIGRIWQRIWQKSCLVFKSPIETTIHKRRVVVNYGYTYPLFARKFANLNNPLIEITHLARELHKRPITFVDVGSAIGDTVLLIEETFPNAIDHYYCIDGDAEFFRYLQHNLRHLSTVSATLALVSSEVRENPALVRTHHGTASAQGSTVVSATTVDLILSQTSINHLDILKIDVDGFDGKVLVGCQELLRRHHPLVIFEWHPILCAQTQNSWLEHFELLAACGYATFVWFTKYGEWCSVMSGYDQATISAFADICLRSHLYPDWHYDIVALPADTGIDIVALAETAYAKRNRSRF